LKLSYSGFRLNKKSRSLRSDDEDDSHDRGNFEGSDETEANLQNFDNSCKKGSISLLVRFGQFH